MAFNRFATSVVGYFFVREGDLAAISRIGERHAQLLYPVSQRCKRGRWVGVVRIAGHAAQHALRLKVDAQTVESAEVGFHETHGRSVGYCRLNVKGHWLVAIRVFAMAYPR